MVFLYWTTVQWANLEYQGSSPGPEALNRVRSGEGQAASFTGQLVTAGYSLVMPAALDQAWLGAWSFGR